MRKALVIIRGKVWMPETETVDPAPPFNSASDRRLFKSEVVSNQTSSISVCAFGISIIVVVYLKQRVR
jgi:hypothetical protein